MTITVRVSTWLEAIHGHVWECISDILGGHVRATFGYLYMVSKRHLLGKHDHQFSGQTTQRSSIVSTKNVRSIAAKKNALNMDRECNQAMT